MTGDKVNACPLCSGEKYEDEQLCGVCQEAEEKERNFERNLEVLGRWLERDEWKHEAEQQRRLK